MMLIFSSVPAWLILKKLSWLLATSLKSGHSPNGVASRYEVVHFEPVKDTEGNAWDFDGWMTLFLLSFEKSTVNSTISTAKIVVMQLQHSTVVFENKIEYIFY